MMVEVLFAILVVGAVLMAVSAVVSWRTEVEHRRQRRALAALRAMLAADNALIAGAAHLDPIVRQRLMYRKAHLEERITALESSL